STILRKKNHEYCLHHERHGVWVPAFAGTTPKFLALYFILATRDANAAYLNQTMTNIEATRSSRSLTRR
ncbi:MAG: hypothetical protein J0H25_11975, partial [Rhizobiales bacterium]|nr:hypothetical protein [Hyphomicrobiales bacterium]